MSAWSVEKRNVVNFGARREERGTAGPGRGDLDEQRRALEKERQALAEERRLLEQDRAAFDDDLSVLEAQRRFLDTQREKLRQETLALEAKKEELVREQQAVAAKAAVRARVETDLGQARETLEAERRQLRAELAGLVPARPAKDQSSTGVLAPSKGVSWAVS